MNQGRSSHCLFSWGFCSAEGSSLPKCPLCPTSPSDWPHGLQQPHPNLRLFVGFVGLDVAVGTGSWAAVQLAFLLVDLGAQVFGEIKNVFRFYPPLACPSSFGTLSPYVVLENQKLVEQLGMYLMGMKFLSPTLIFTLWQDLEVSDFLQMYM